MKQPDRFDRMIARITGPAWCPDSDIPKGEVVVLLRRQHAAYVRMVRHIGDTVEAGESGTSAIKKVLAALARYRKGKS